MDRRSGFALVELLVAISIFLAVVSIGVGGFARALRTIRQNASFVSASGNVSLALEQMAREMRTGYDFCVNGQLCAPSAGIIDEVVFKNAKGDVVSYKAENDVIARTCSGVCDGEPGQKPLTSTTVVIKHLGFKVFGNTAGDSYQPRITITIGVTTRDPGTANAVMTLETTVSSRFPLDS